jgi:hypothetical protein
LRVEWTYIPQTPLITPLYATTSGEAPRRTIGMNSTVYDALHAAARKKRDIVAMVIESIMIGASWCAPSIQKMVEKNS